MNSDIILMIKRHKLWLDTLGQNGEKIYLEEEVIEGGYWENISLSQGNIISCVFKDMVLKQWDFYATALYSTYFEKLLIKHCGFVKAELPYTKFFETKLEDSNFSKTDFSYSNFENVEIKNSNLINTLLYNVCFKNVCFCDVDFTGANIENVLFDNCTGVKKIYGLDSVHIKSINIGSLEKPIYLNGDDAIQWLKC